jgi:3-hydroxyisobutyrate dehydrogenase-like beta-hydroxyacid dehydrogenase
LSAQEPIGVIGTGLLGSALADRLLAEGFPTIVHNRTRSKADPLLAKGAVWSDDPLAQCRRVIFSLFTAEQVQQVLDRMSGGLRAGQIVIDTSTSDPRKTTALGKQLAALGVEYLESPISGSSEQTRNHQSTALVAGDRAAFDACQDLWDCLAAKTYYLGPWGNASRMKLVTNLVLGLNRAALAEGLTFADKIGLPADAALEVLINSPAYSRIMESKGQKMVRGDFTPQARLSQHLKDVRLIMDEANRGSASLPLSDVHLMLLERAEAAGLGELDNSALIRVLQNPNLLPKVNET